MLHNVINLRQHFRNRKSVPISFSTSRRALCVFSRRCRRIAKHSIASRNLIGPKETQHTAAEVTYLTEKEAIKHATCEAAHIVEIASGRCRGNLRESTRATEWEKIEFKLLSARREESERNRRSVTLVDLKSFFIVFSRNFIETAERQHSYFLSIDTEGTGSSFWRKPNEKGIIVDLICILYKPLSI